MTSNIGTVEGLSSSGTGWGSGRSGDIRNMFFNTLKSKNVKRSVKISTFSLGNDNEEVNEFFSLIEELLKSERDVEIIVNDDQKGSCSKHAKITMREFKKRFPDRFHYYLFNSKSKNSLKKILHAKLVVVDRTTGLVGSANISKGALLSNYEIMLKISGDVVSKLSLMFDELVKILEKEKHEA